MDRTGWKILSGHFGGSIAIVIFLWAVLVQLYSDILYPLIFGRTLVFLTLLPLLALVYFIFGRIQPGEKVRFWWKNPVLWSWLALFVVAWIASILGGNLYKSIWSTMERATGLILWSGALGFLLFLLTSVREHKGWRNLLFVVALIGWIIAGYSLLQVILPHLVFVGTRGAISSLFGNQVYVGLFIALTIPLLMYFGLFARALWSKLFWFSGAILQLLALYWAHTAGGVVAVVGGLAVFFVLVLAIHFRWSFFKALSVFVGLGLVGVAGVLLPLFGGKTLASIYLDDVSTISRLGFYRTAWEAIKAKPLFGYGWENARIAIQEHYNIPHGVVSFAETNTDRIHNVLLQTGVNAGWAGVLAYLVIIATVAYKALSRVWDREVVKENRYLTAAVLAGLSGYLFGLQFAFSVVSTVIVSTILTGYIIYSTSAVGSVSKKYASASAWGMGLLLLVFGWISLHNLIPTFAPAKLADEAATLEDRGNYSEALVIENKIKGYKGVTPYYYGLIKDYSKIAKDYALSAQGKPEYETVLQGGLSILDELEKFDNRDYILLDRPILYAQLVSIDRDKYFPLMQSSFQQIHSWNENNTYLDLFWARMLMSAGLLNEADQEFGRLVAMSEPPRGTYLWQAALRTFQAKPASDIVALVEKAKERKELVVANTGDMPYQIVHQLIKVLVDAKRWDLVLGLQENLILTSRGNVAEEWINLAIAYKENGRIEDAVKAARRSVDLDPNLRQAAESFLAQLGYSL